MKLAAPFVDRLRLVGGRWARQSPLEAELSLNLSLVLHERSDSSVVRRTMLRGVRHAREVSNSPPAFSTPSTTSMEVPGGVDMWLSASIGCPDRLATALHKTTGEQHAIILIDAVAQVLRERTLFRAPALLNLPVFESKRVGVAALVVRPGGQSTHLVIEGGFEWPRDADGVIRAVERIIQAFPDQWLVSRPLWPGPAEAMLPNEMVPGLNRASQ